MSGPKKWVSSKVRGKSSSKHSSSSSANINSNSSTNNNNNNNNIRRQSLSSFASSSVSNNNSPLDLTSTRDDRTPPSPPTRLPTGSSSATNTTMGATSTATTAFIDFGSGSTLINSNDGSHHGNSISNGGSLLLAAHHGDSSIDTNETGGFYSTSSPSTTPPKKTWERNYKSFLKRSNHGKQSASGGLLSGSLAGNAATGNAANGNAGGGSGVRNQQQQQQQQQHHHHHHHSFGPLPRFNFTKSDSPKHSPKNSPKTLHYPHTLIPPTLPPTLPQQPLRAMSENNATAHLMKQNHQLQQLQLQQQQNQQQLHHQNNQQHPPSFPSDASLDLGPSLVDGFTTKTPSSSINNNHNNHNHNKESSTRGGSIFKAVFRNSSSNKSNSNNSSLEDSSHRGRLRSKTKSADTLDFTLRKGIDRKSPSNTPPGSAVASPRRSPEVSDSASGSGSSSNKQQGQSSEEEKAAALYKHINNNNNNPQQQPSLDELDSSLVGRLMPNSKSVTGVKSSHNLSSHGGGDSLDQPRHHGHALSSDRKHALFARVASMGSNLTIREGHEGFVATHQIDPTASNAMAVPGLGRNSTLGRVCSSNNNNLEGYGIGFVNTEEAELIRERKKAFTDFHNMGVDSSSAYLGDEPSLHNKSSIFLSSMAYPAGSAGGKARNRPTHGINGPHSLDQRNDNNYMPSTSMSALGMTPHLTETGEVSPERALRPLDGPEHWKKGERHAILPAILCMCPIQVLNNIMSKDEGTNRNAPNPATTNRGYGIGSIITEGDSSPADNSGNDWFFGEHNHYPTSGVGALSHHRVGAKSNVPSSAFGKIILGKATVAALGMRSFLGEVYGWCTGVFVLRQNYLFEFRENDSLNGLPWGYAMLQLAEAYPHKHFTNALHLDFFEKPCSKSGKRSLLIRVESKEERDRWVSLLHSAARMTIQDLYDVDESEGGAEFGRGRYAVVRPAKRRVHRRGMSVSETRYPHASTSHDTFRSVSSTDSLSGCRSSCNDLSSASAETEVALKIIDKKEFWSRVKKGRERADTLVREAAVQTSLVVQGADTPGFLQLRSIFETGEQLVMELELLKGIDLFQHISSRGTLDEMEAAHIMRDLLTCLDVMDQIGIAHRDIKPANLLMCDNNNSDGTRVKLADYGMASFVGVDNLVRGRCGTPGFVAPEILRTGVSGGYGNKVDMFSAGVTLYVMLAGYEPFYGESDAELIDANRNAQVDFPHADWHTVSIEGRDLIERMLVVDPAKRIGPREALRHPWITRRAPQPAAPCNDPGDFQVACSTC